MGNRKVADLHEEAAGADLEVVAEEAGYKAKLDAIHISIPLPCFTCPGNGACCLPSCLI